MITCLGKSCSFGLPRVPFVNCCQFIIYVFSYFPFGFEGRMWDLIVSVPDHCLSFYFENMRLLSIVSMLQFTRQLVDLTRSIVKLSLTRRFP